MRHDGFDGHDTHVASYAAGRLAGVATNARIYSLRTTWQGDDSNAVDGGEFCRHGSDTDVAVAAAIDWIRLHGREEHGAGPAVVNYSGGRGNASVRRAILEATDAGYLFTLSGNTGGAVERHWGSCDANPVQTAACRGRRSSSEGRPSATRRSAAGMEICWDSTRPPRGCTARAKNRTHD